jgi:hypothetical protein
MIQFYHKLKRNICTGEAIGLLIYKVQFKLLSKFWKYFPKFTNKSILKVLEKEVSDQEFLQANFRIFEIKHSNRLIPLSKEDISKILELADLYLSDNYKLLGAELTHMNPINWHIDFKTGYIWNSGIFYQDYIQESITNNSDVKVPRELSRCHHLLNLAVAFLITEDSKYAQKIINQIRNWLVENPLMFSINWGCTMDVAIRACNWIWALSQTKDYWAKDDSFVNAVKNSLFQHGWFIYRNLEKEPVNNHNHYLADIAGLVHLGLLFKDSKEGAKWLDEGIKELFKEIRYQILPTGMSYERSTNYNRLVLELVMTPLILLKQNGYQVPDDIWFKLETMFDFLIYTLKPDGHSPIIGDQDNGRLLPFGVENQTDYSYLFALGAVLFKRGDLKYLSKGFNIYSFMMGGLKAKEIYDSLESVKLSIGTKAFKDAGIYVMRKENNYLLFNASGKGTNAEIDKDSSTHTHSDQLSFELVANGKTFLVDPGSYVYTADAIERYKFRSTFMHNTVCIDNLSQDNINVEKLWSYEYCAIPEIREWVTNELFDKIIASHTGYMRLKDPIKHIRELIFNKQTLSWEINDYFEGTGTHRYDWYFHFDSEIDFIIEGNFVKTICEDGKNIIAEFETQIPIKFNKINSMVSKSYGIKEKSFSLNLYYEGPYLPKLKIKIYSY